jgi:hypothetical protein
VIAKLVNMDFRIVPPWRADQAGCRRRWLWWGMPYLPGSIRAKTSVGPSLAGGAAMVKIAAKP